MFYTLKDFNFAGKRVLLRTDFNVPITNGQITDESRIEKSLPTIKYILNSKPEQFIIVSHLGRPQGTYSPEFTLTPVHKRLEQILSQKIHFDTNPRIRNVSSLLIEKLIMFENLRFDLVEESNNEEFARQLADLADIFVFDAFATSHREHASVVGIPKFIPSCAGFLMQKEVLFLRDKMLNPERPLVTIIGGAKEDKIKVIKNMLQKVDNLLIGGVLANTFLKSKNINIGQSKYSEQFLGYAKQIISSTYSEKISLPVDFVVADEFAEFAKSKVAGLSDEIDDWMVLDIGPYTIAGFLDIIRKARTVVWAGPVGVFEWSKFRKGTKELAITLAGLDITKIVGGGDSAAAIEFFKLTDKMTHVSTGGGASLELLSGKELPGIKALEENYQKFKQ